MRKSLGGILNEVKGQIEIMDSMVDDLRVLLDAQDGESLQHAAGRLVRERDALKAERDAWKRCRGCGGQMPGLPVCDDCADPRGK